MFLGSRVAAGALSWQPYRHLCADCLNDVGSLTYHSPIGLHDPLRAWLYFFYVDDVWTSQKTRLLASTFCYGR
jgi:hypothetical protein